LCNTAEPSGELSVGDMVVVGENPLTVDRAGFSPLTGVFAPVRIHEHGTHPLLVSSRPSRRTAPCQPGEEGDPTHEPRI
jgi:hypothetical protein